MSCFDWINFFAGMCAGYFLGMFLGIMMAKGENKI